MHGVVLDHYFISGDDYEPTWPNSILKLKMDQNSGIFAERLYTFKSRANFW